MNNVMQVQTEKPNIHSYLQGGVIRLVFLLCGGKFYLNWILVTNPTSKNPLIKLLYGWMKSSYSAKDFRNRYGFAWFFGIIHMVIAILMFIDGRGFTITNLLVNIYPIVVQLYIGFRCWRVMNFKTSV